jgi:hypothetical protein
MNDPLTPLKVLELTYGDNLDDVTPEAVWSLNESSKRWVKFIKENYVIKEENDKRD